MAELKVSQIEWFFYFFNFSAACVWSQTHGPKGQRFPLECSRWQSDRLENASKNRESKLSILTTENQKEHSCPFMLHASLAGSPSMAAWTDHYNNTGIMNQCLQGSLWTQYSIYHQETALQHWSNGWWCFEKWITWGPSSMVDIDLLQTNQCLQCSLLTPRNKSHQESAFQHQQNRW